MGDSTEMVCVGMTPDERAEEFSDEVFYIHSPAALREWIAMEIRLAEGAAYEDTTSLIQTLIDSCNPTNDQRSALERAQSVIRARHSAGKAVR